MRTLLELLRVIFLLFIIGAVGGFILSEIYSLNEAVESYGWLGGLAVLVLFFILYRNKLQFSGWYKGEGRKQLPKRVSSALIVVSILLLVSPCLLSYLIS